MKINRERPKDPRKCSLCGCFRRVKMTTPACAEDVGYVIRICDTCDVR